MSIPAGMTANAFVKAMKSQAKKVRSRYKEAFKFIVERNLGSGRNSVELIIWLKNCCIKANSSNFGENCEF